jgi:hypothetical protein
MHQHLTPMSDARGLRHIDPGLLAAFQRLSLVRGNREAASALGLPAKDRAVEMADDGLLDLLPPLALNAEQLCRVTPFCREFVFAEIKSGRLPSRKMGRHRVMLLADILDWLTGERQVAA